MDLQLWPSCLTNFLHEAHHFPSLRCCGGHEEIILSHTPCGAIIHDNTVITQHNAVTRATNGQFGKAVNVETVDIFSRIRALHSDFP